MAVVETKSKAKGGDASTLGYAHRRWFGAAEAAGGLFTLGTIAKGAYSLLNIATTNGTNQDITVEIGARYTTPDGQFHQVATLTILAGTSQVDTFTPVTDPDVVGAIDLQLKWSIAANDAGDVEFQLGMMT